MNVDGWIADLRRKMQSLAKKEPQLFSADTEASDYITSEGEGSEYEQASAEITMANSKPFDITVVEKKQVRLQDEGMTQERPRRQYEGPEERSFMDKISKWNCVYNGKDPLAYLDRINEIKEAYAVREHQLFHALPLMLKGQPLAWYRNHKVNWESWKHFESAFRHEYVDAQTPAQKYREIMNRFQRPQESIREYVSTLTTMMRHAGVTDEETKVDVVYENLRIEFKIQFRRKLVKTVDDLSEMAMEYEKLINEEASRGKSSMFGWRKRPEANGGVNE